ncbi:MULTISPECIES: hypothetical protein [unclassified Streptomyces]|uniref:hypothetical protein n=1 Tax=unclassified Streptomyces TaxID=2593676 RepID=UPI0035D6E1F7
MTGPEHVQEAEALLKLARLSDKSSASSAAGAARAAGAQAHALLALVAAQAAAPAVPPAAQAVTVYRAAYEHLPFPLGLYATAEAARAHCEALVSGEYAADAAVLFEWFGDEDGPESVWEAAVRIGDQMRLTGYTVTAVVAEAAYDPEAED